ncbi:hypothetical protein ACGH7X_14860 [Streptomyces sp. BBFR51]|uniref:hypothetical protein n=1 Tax=Streptomyces sp. BBFR51 TaxID=3372856 RepID=UPI0037DC0F26
MSVPVHRTPERPSVAALTAARERRETGRSGSSSGSSGSSGTSAEQALLGLQSSAGNQAAAATVQRARGRALERTPGTDTTRAGSAPGTRRAPAGRARGGSAPGALADRTPLDPESGIRTASDPEVRSTTSTTSTTSTPERAATPEATTATRFAPSGRTRRGSESDTRPDPAGPVRRGSVSGTQGMEVDPGFREQIDTARDEARLAAERAAEEARLAAERAAKEARLAALAAGFAPSGRTRRGSESDTRSEPAGPIRRGSVSGTHGMEVDPGFQEHVDTARDEARLAAEEEEARTAAERAAEEARLAAERAAKEARIAALAATFTPSGRTRRGSDLGTRPDPAGLTRRGSETGIRDMEVDTGFQEHVDTARDEARRAAEEEETRLAEERAAAERARLAAERATAEEARIAALAARFTPSGRTRRGSDLGTRPDPAGLTRRGSETGIRDMEVDTGFQEHVDTARDQARTAAEEREPEEARTAAAAADSEARSDRLKAVAENADQGKRLLDPTDALGKGVQAPTAAGLGQEATAKTASGAPDASALKHDAAAAGVSGASVSALTELLALGASVADSFRNLKASLRKKTGAGHHNARKKAKTKATDAGVSVTSTGANAGALAKDAVKLQGVANTASAAEASGILSAVAGLAKSIRALGKVGGATSKYRKLRKLGDAGVVHAGLLDGLQTQANTAERDAATAYAAITALETELNGGRARAELNDALTAAVTAYEAAALLEAQAKVAYFSALRDVDTLTDTTKLAKKKQVSKGAKEAMGGVVGEGLKGAGGIATAAIVATGALASNPAGWIIAGVGAGLVVTVAGYKGGRAATKRFQEAHHPERYTPDGEETPVAQPTWESLKHAMKVWKKVSRHKRRLAAHRIYAMASSPDTAPDLRRSALELLVVIKSGPKEHKMEQEAWEASLMDPAGKADWIKEITDQLSSGS